MSLMSFLSVHVASPRLKSLFKRSRVAPKNVHKILTFLFF
jgi:hypothetical protein